MAESSLRSKPGDNSSVTSREIARQAQVSVGTVYRVLSNEPNVDNELRSRVLRVIDELGYVHFPRKRTQVGLRSLTKPQTGISTVTFCVPARKPPGTALHHVLHGVESECAQNNISLHYTVIEDKSEAAAQFETLLERDNPDGLILVNYSSPALVEKVLALKLPVILIDPREQFGMNVDIVTSESFNGMLMGMEHLVQLGHREIALINSPYRYSGQRRNRAYILALIEHNLPYAPEKTTHCELTVEGGEAAVRELLARGVRFTALCCANDLVAWGAIRALNAAGLRVPQDVSVIGNDNLEVATLATPALTTINADNEGKGRVAVQRLIERNRRPDAPYINAVLPVALVKRASTASFAG
jgi:LacI family transcriptional regulator